MLFDLKLELERRTEPLRLLIRVVEAIPRRQEPLHASFDSGIDDLELQWQSTATQADRRDHNVLCSDQCMVWHNVKPNIAYLSLHRCNQLIMRKRVVNPHVLDAAWVRRGGAVARERGDIEIAVCNECIHHVATDVVTPSSKDHDILESRHGCNVVSDGAM